jgi:hypothetical protein
MTQEATWPRCSAGKLKAIASKPASHSLVVEDKQMDFCSMMRIGG